MQFCSVGAKNIEVDRVKGMANALVFDETFTDSIIDNASLYKALPKVKSFIETFDGSIFTSTACAGQLSNKLYLAMSGNLSNVTTEYSSNPYPPSSSTATEEVICLRHFYSHRGDANLGTFAGEYQSAFWGYSGNTDKIGDKLWGSYIPRLIVQPDIAGNNGNLCIDKSASGSFSMSYSFSQSIYSYTYRHWYGCAYMDFTSKVFTYGTVGYPFTWAAGANVVGTYKRNSLVLFQGGQSYTRTGGTTTPSGANRGQTYAAVDRTGEGGVHQPYVARTAADDGSKAINQLYFGVSHIDRNIIFKLKAGEDFTALNASPRDVLNISAIAGKNFNLFSYYSVNL